MAAHVPQTSPSNDELGPVVDTFPLKRVFLARWGYLVLGVLCLLGALLIGGWGGWDVYQRYYAHGPSVVARSVVFPILAGLPLLIIGLAGLHTAWLNWPKVAIICQNGLEVHRREGIFSCQWEAVASLRSISTTRLILGIPAGPNQRIIVTREDGERLLLDDSYSRAAQLVELIKQKTLPLIYTRVMSEINAGHTVKFGPFQLNADRGLSIRTETYSWEQIAEPAIRFGTLHLNIINPDGKTNQVRVNVADIPGIEILLSVIDEMCGRG